MRAHRGRHGAPDNWCVLEYNTQTKKADRLINYDGAVRKISVPTVVLCYLQWKANPNGDGTGLENRRALIAPLEFDSLAFRQNLTASANVVFVQHPSCSEMISKL